MKTMNVSKNKQQYSKGELDKIRERARAIWKRKCDDMKTALDDWLQAEREFRSKSGIENKKPEEYTAKEIQSIKKRAQEVRDEKVSSLRTAFDDWIEAEKELKDELGKKIDVNTLFDIWFTKTSPHVTRVLNTGETVSSSDIYAVMGEDYIDMMYEVLN